MVNRILCLLVFCLINFSMLGQTVPPPDVPILSTNTCGVKTLTVGIPLASANVVWYWQGTDPNGILTNNSFTTYTVADANDQTFYIRAKSTITNLWSAAVGVKVTTNPTDINVDSYQAQNPLAQATHSVTLKPGFAVTTGSTFNARIAITPECNDIYYNWSEEIAYDQNGQPLSRARSYTSGLGQNLQTQSLDKAGNMIWVTQPIYDKNNNAAASTLPAPISDNDFAYKSDFVNNAAGQPYGDADFNLPATANKLTGEIDNPKPVDNTKPNTVGWYYSNNNTLEPNTPTTAYPYSRSYTPEGPNPTITKSAAPGDAYKMGLGNEVTSNEFKINVGELDHYYDLRQYFVSTTDPFATNLLGYVSTTTTTQFTATAGVSIGSAGGYVSVACTQIGGTPGVYPIGGYITTTPGKDYILRVKGYRSSSSTANANLYINSASSAVVLWPGPLLPLGSANEAWVSVKFTAPSDASAIRVGVLWNTPASNTPQNIFYISAIDLKSVSPTTSIGYKYISTDPDDKKTATFVDADGKTLATALVTSKSGPDTNPVYAYDYWSYSYYNDMGQLVASVAPNGVNTASKASPQFVTTYKYDHLGRLIETTSPDEGTSKFVYSTDGKIRFSENQVQRNATTKRFSYTNYNYAGELVESGEYSGSGTNPYVFEPHSILTTPGAYSVLNLIDIDIPRGLDIESITTSTDPAIFKGTSAKLDPARCSDYTYIKYDKQASDLPAGDAAHAQQNNLFGQISKTQNASATTWYSYDEFGQLAWSKQSLPDIGYKTVDYTYDYFGNVTQTIYQSGQTDKFYHYYTYDVDNRLIKAETSLDGTTKTLQAKYYYYLHGPLKRVELANNLQGIDYTYTLQGALKSINHMDVTNDPGADGIAGAHSTFSKDVFGLTLSYFDNDFTSGGHNAGNVSPSGSANSYAGTLKGVGWFTPVDNTPIKRSYNYTYDSRNQLQNAQWGTVTGTNGSYTTAPSLTAYKEGMGAIPIDKNGNIKSMVRYNKTGTSIANYTYDYDLNTNKLDKVNDGGSILVDYGYNTIGQMTSYIEASNTINVLYNAYGLVSEVRKVTNPSTNPPTTIPVEKFVYDDRGDRIQKINYNDAGDAVVKTTCYVHDVSGNVLAIYEKTTAIPTPTLVEVPVYGGSRLGEYKPGKTTFYEMNDHLGNVRAVIGAPFTETITATMETENMTAEDKLFKNIAPRTQSSTAAANNTPGGDEAIFLNNARPVGPASIIKVAPGDVISISTYAYYEGGTGYNSTTASSTIISAITSAFGGVINAPGDPGKIYTAINSALAGGGFSGLAGSSDTNVPAAYLNMIMFDGNMVPDPVSVPMAAMPVTSAANWNKQLITIGPITIPSPGYLYIYVNDNSNSANRVYFDDLAITQLHSPFVAGGDFYPYGLTMEDRQIKIEPYRYGFQGQFSEKDLTTGWNEFELRMYDARFGRWLSPDPYGEHASPYMAMGNTPNTTTDPDGGCETCELLRAQGYTVLDHFSVTAINGLISDNGMIGLTSLASSDGLNATDAQLRRWNSPSVDLGMPSISLASYTQPTTFLNPSKPNIFARWNASSIPGSSFTYGIVNGAYIGLSTVFLKAFIGNDIYNLDDTYASYKERQIGFLSTAAMLVPMGRGSTAVKQVTDVAEQMALEELIANPSLGSPIPGFNRLTDSRWWGWTKMESTKVLESGRKIHMHFNAFFDKWGKMVGIDDFKLK
ncbi:MAG: RHS repeat-associated core domain-containing protein [Chryseolinea sp.]